MTRVARDYGDRTVAMNAIKQLLDSISLKRPIDASEPFLAPAKRFDTISPGTRIDDWMLAASAEEFERLHSFSSLYTGDSSRSRLELIASLGFGSEEMSRRLQLLDVRFGTKARLATRIRRSFHGDKVIKAANRVGGCRSAIARIKFARRYAPAANSADIAQQPWNMRPPGAW